MREAPSLFPLIVKESEGIAMEEFAGSWHGRGVGRAEAGRPGEGMRTGLGECGAQEAAGSLSRGIWMGVYLGAAGRKLCALEP